jgi:acetyl-CoA carboxylase carboxyltransferase component
VDVRAQQAREHNRRAAADEESAAGHRDARDRLVRVLRAEDPGRWTYRALAVAVDCSPELIAHIIRTGVVTREVQR